jgi:molybdenum cofactor guanylyltransferase
MTNSTGKLHCLILSGGKSSRMGSDKSELTLKGETLLTRTLQTVQALQPTQLLISSNNSAQQNNARHNNAQCLADNFKDLGPLAGIEAAIKFIQEHTIIDENDLLMIVPVDMPLLQTSTLKLLINHAIQQKLQRPTNSAWCFDGYPMPLLLTLSSNLYEQVFAQLHAHTQGEQSNLSVQGLLKRLDLYKVSLEPVNREQFINCNTPEDWAKVNLMTQTHAVIDIRNKN